MEVKSFMKIKVSFKNLEHTPALDEKIHQKTEKLEKYLDGNTEVHWTCRVNEGGLHSADIHLSGPSFQYNASADSDSMYKSLDMAISKIEKQLSRKKDKWKNKIHRHADITSAPISHGDNEEEDLQESESFRLSKTG